MFIIEYFKKRTAKKTIVKKMPRILKKKYGKRKQYSKKQIDTVLFNTGIELHYHNYAYAMFMKKFEFDKMQQDDADYSTLRTEISDSYFQGNENFTIHDAIDGADHDVTFSGDAAVFDTDGWDSDGDSD